MHISRIDYNDIPRREGIFFCFVYQKPVPLHDLKDLDVFVPIKRRALGIFMGF
jgi:hypothetical protein